MISVVMSVYNEEEDWLKESIESVLNQSFSDFEFIIINDNPSRYLNEQIITHYKKIDSRIVYLKNSQNIGLTKSLNFGLSCAKGNYIARFDADDICYPTRFEKQVDFLDKHQDIIAVGSWFEYFGKINKKNTEYRCTPDEIQNFLMIYTPIAHPTVMIRKSELDKYQLKYNEDFRYAQDYDFFYQLSKVGKMANLPEVLLKYRTTEKQVSSKNAFEQQQLAISLRKKIITTLVTHEFLNEFNVNEISNPLKAFIKLNRNSYKLKDISANQEQRINILKYVMLISSKRLVDRIILLILLALNPFQKIGFSSRYYFKAISHQIFFNYKSLL